jgi:hypothetical protein
MTYANDCIQMRDRHRGLKRIERHTDKELDAAVEAAHRRFGDEFWLLLHGIDAYQERRKRRSLKNARIMSEAEFADCWGDERQ